MPRYYNGKGYTFIEYDGKLFRSIFHLADYYGVRKTTLRQRVSKGVSIADAIRVGVTEAEMVERKKAKGEL